MRAFVTLGLALSCVACSGRLIMPTDFQPEHRPAVLSNDAEPSYMQGMLATHNQYRAAVGVPALRWSKHLSAYAQEWANYLATKNSCKMTHRTEAKADPLNYGENLYWASPVEWTDGRKDVQKIAPFAVAKAWGDERVDYSHTSNSCRTGEQCGHYTQMVWRNTTHVGCAMTVCPNKAQLWVCNYNPPGNWVGQRPY